MASKSYASNKCCSVLQCSSRAGGGISLHTFPKNAALTKRWKHILRIGKPITKDMYVCSLHFKQKDFYAKLHRDPVKLENSLLENTNTIEDFNYPSDNISEPEKKIWRGRVKRGRKKQLKTDEDEVIEYIESLEARKRLPHCVVCSRPLRQNKKEYLSTLTSTTGLSLHQCLIGIADGKSTNIQDFTASDMVCFYCAHLINYADALEAELMKLKNAINGCLEIQNMNEEDQEMLKPEFDSHIAILDEYSERVVGPGSAAERESLVDESHPPVDTGTLDLDKKNECPLAQENGKPFVINSITSIPGDTEPTLFEEDGRNYVSVETNTSSEAEIWKNRTVEGDELLNAKESSPLKVDPPQLECKICNLRTSSRSVLLFHLRRHMAHYQWCDFCDYTIIDEDEGELASKPAPT